ncbi:hypothetical protein BJ165DRAFT_1478806 [Panaeolus papilionaceus]|nr:hypothetical protein BJ165DRAFT_1478806 [Panaeolus papilionaceus]
MSSASVKSWQVPSDSDDDPALLSLPADSAGDESPRASGPSKRRSNRAPSASLEVEIIEHQPAPVVNKAAMARAPAAPIKEVPRPSQQRQPPTGGEQPSVAPSASAPHVSPAAPQPAAKDRAAPKAPHDPEPPATQRAAGTSLAQTDPAPQNAASDSTRMETDEPIWEQVVDYGAARLQATEAAIQDVPMVNIGEDDDDDDGEESEDSFAAALAASTQGAAKPILVSSDEDENEDDKEENDNDDNGFESAFVKAAGPASLHAASK